MNGNVTKIIYCFAFNRVSNDSNTIKLTSSSKIKSKYKYNGNKKKEKIQLIFSLILPVISSLHINSVVYYFRKQKISITFQFTIVMDSKLAQQRNFKDNIKIVKQSQNTN